MASPRIAGSNITAIVADQYSVCRAGVRAALNGTAKVLGEAADGHAAIKAIRRLRPVVAVIGYWLPLLNGMGVAQTILSSRVDTTRIILHTSKWIRLQTKSGGKSRVRRLGRGDRQDMV
jgi:DNA-binding NarL/FixJ family response regulator